MKAPIASRSVLDVALEYADRGWPVIPLLPGQKRPRLDKWQRQASADPVQVREWFERWPESNVGQLMGVSCDAVDVDVKNGGLATLAHLELTGVLDGCFARVNSASGGQHLYFPALGAQRSKSWLDLGIEFKSTGTQLVMPPSLFKGRPYTWHIGDGVGQGQPLLLEDLEAALQQLQAGSGIGPAAERLRATPEGGRNNALNREAWKAATGDLVVLAQAAVDSGLDPEEVERTLASVRASRYSRDLTRELTRRVVSDEAKRLHLRMTRPAAEPVETPTLAEVLALPPEPPMRVGGLIPSDAFTLLVAQAKTGKTVFVLNLIGSLLTGRPFLGIFPVQPVTRRVAILNFEVSNRQLARWCADLELDPQRVLLVPLRGVGNPLAAEDTRADLASKLRDADVETLVVDPFSQAFTGSDENSTSEVGPFIRDLVRFAREGVGARDLVLVAHAGHNGERVRGNTRLLGDPDSIITLVKDGEGRRFMHATGRDVDVPEDQLEFDPVTRALTKSGVGSRKAVGRRAKAELIPHLLRIVETHPGIGRRDLVRKLRDDPTVGVGFQDSEVYEAARQADEQGLIRTETGGPGKPTKHYRCQMLPTTAEMLPGSATTNSAAADPERGGSTSGSGSSRAGPLDPAAPQTSRVDYLGGPNEH